MDLSEINWDINEAGGWPVSIKIIAGLCIFFLIIGGGHYQFTSEKLNELNREEAKLTTAINSYGTNWRMALNLKVHQQQYSTIEASLTERMRLMPTQAEMASLLADISQAGVVNGLEFTLFKPVEKIIRDDVVALPINIKVQGMYKELGLFISALAALPRIVTIKDIQISLIKKNNLLKMEATVITYQEIEAQEEQGLGLMDNSYLTCLKEEGLIIEGCTGTSPVNLTIFPELVQRLKSKRESLTAIRIGEIKKIQALEVFVFNPDDTRDPFNLKSPDKHEVAKLSKEDQVFSPDFKRKKGVLEGYSLEELELMGSIKKENSAVIWGLIRVSSGKVYRVKKGSYLGKNYGKVLGVSSAKIDIREIIRNEQGSWKKKVTSIALSKSNDK
jgi:type IV pilus assembly protein PilO